MTYVYGISPLILYMIDLNGRNALLKTATKSTTCGNRGKVAQSG